MDFVGECIAAASARTVSAVDTLFTSTTVDIFGAVFTADVFATGVFEMDVDGPHPLTSEILAKTIANAISNDIGLKIFKLSPPYGNKV